MSKGSKRRPEAKPGAYAEGWDRAYGCKHKTIETDETNVTFCHDCDETWLYKPGEDKDAPACPMCGKPMELLGETMQGLKCWKCWKSLDCVIQDLVVTGEVDK